MSDALLAAELLAAAPARLGGMWLRGQAAERDAVLAFLAEEFAGLPVRRLPVHIDEERLCGGIDVASSLSAGRRIEQAGLLEEVAGGLLIVPMAERLGGMVAGRIAQAMDAGAGFALVLIDDGGEEEVPPVSLTERVAFWCDFSANPASTVSGSDLPRIPERSRGTRALPVAKGPSTSLGNTEGGLELAKADRQTLANITLALGIDSARAMLFAQSALWLSAHIEDRDAITDDDTQFVARTVLGPRATRIPQQAEEPPPPPPPEGEDEPPPGDNDGEDEQHDPDQLDDLILASVLASIPKDVLARIGEGRSARRATGGGGAGRKRASQMRGRPLGARPGLPRGGARLALIDTLRTAVPWQEIRRQQEGVDAPKRLRIRKGDLRIRRFEERAEALTIFAVDASGSSALARLAEAKGAVELMLAQSYVKRAQVALIAFRGTSAELLLPPTRSLTRAKKVLGELPGGGGTPLALGLSAAGELAETQAARGRTPFVALLTDGKGNIDKNGQPGRAQAGEDALAAAKRFAQSGTQAVVIDISARPQPEAAAIAAAMRARYLALPRADARGVERAVSALQFGKST
ncbi:magnesium chelatase subunit D [Blastomonas aquatica]|uniref:Magnesium-chelatase 60 kDa subunit n=1 Tax=Blastomonas aquatica TaxID=1510276 RepID=A0ABQ1JTV4_9SPHN|nr:magnesium chelatase subunit D [Blastomonas aquatica]GGB75183.1 magnesium-chelatase 60 kDa subunit [Blastomonas aquatica]